MYYEMHRSYALENKLFLSCVHMVIYLGAFFQWIVCLGIWTSGICIHIYNGHNRQFYPLEMIGGVLWGLGNICVVPIVKTIGLAMGLLIWGTLNLLTGWATGRY